MLYVSTNWMSTRERGRGRYQSVRQTEDHSDVELYTVDDGRTVSEVYNANNLVSLSSPLRLSPSLHRFAPTSCQMFFVSFPFPYPHPTNLRSSFVLSSVFSRSLQRQSDCRGWCIRLSDTGTRLLGNFEEERNENGSWLV